jgi:DNA helicase II / ATP-dependent DNA helicase PcrA
MTPASLSLPPDTIAAMSAPSTQPSAVSRADTRAERVLAALDAEQRAVATALSGPVCVLAGAGTGKTRAITHRIAYGVLTGAVEPRRVLAVTFTTRAAGELRGRLRSLGVDSIQARTFHSAAFRQARFFWPKVVGGELPKVVETKLPLIREAATRCRLGADQALLRDLAGEIEWAKVSNVSAEDYPALADMAGREVAGLKPDVVAQIYGTYAQVCSDRGVIDMEDVLLSAVSVLDMHPGVAEQVRAQYGYFVVDEYQDVSPLQQRLLQLWLGDREDVCVVGDPNQTIYSFAGARPDYLVGFPDRYPQATVVRLVRDYRSTPQLVTVANRILARAAGKAARHRLVLQAQRSDGPSPKFAEHADELDEAEAVAAAVGKLIAAGTAPREIAVLYRVNAQSEAYEQALAEAGVPYVLRGAERFFDRAEVRQAAMLLRGAARAQGDDAAQDGPSLVADVQAVLAGLGWTTTAPTATGAVRERWESLAALVALAEEVAASRPGARLAELSAELEARAAAQHAPSADGVTLASLHAAKGLEWDAVFVVGAQEGTIPISLAQTPEEIEEERRLLYVGVTRAREHLQISWSLARSPGGRGQRQPSRFLVDVLAASTRTNTRSRVRARNDRAGVAARCRICARPLHNAAERKIGRCANCPVTFDEGLFERLRDWRLRTAHEASVPAYVVFTDATLQAIAEARPLNDAALSAIPGVGAVKLDRYGSAVIALCRDTASPAAQESGIEPPATDDVDEIAPSAVARSDRIPK